VGTLEPISTVCIVGDDLYFWYPDMEAWKFRISWHLTPRFSMRGQFSAVRRLSAAVIGASGTGSPVIEQLMRLGFAEIVSIDPINWKSAM